MLVAALSTACAPRIRPLVGSPSPALLPATTLPPGHTRLIFRWEYRDPIFRARGEGVARLAPPDSVRLDFFADGGVGGGFAVLIGDSLATPAADDARRYLPPVPLLWAALGRLHVTAPETLAVVRGDTVQAEIGTRERWRAAFVRGELAELQRVASNRLRESVRRDSTGISYRNHAARRRLSLVLTQRVSDPPFDAAIWVR